MKNPSDPDACIGLPTAKKLDYRTAVITTHIAATTSPTR